MDAVRSFWFAGLLGKPRNQYVWHLHCPLVWLRSNVKTAEEVCFPASLFNTKEISTVKAMSPSSEYLGSP